MMSKNILWAEAMIHQPLVVTPDTLVTEALRLMNSQRTGDALSHAAGQSWLATTASASCVLVITGQQLVGIFTEQDVVRLNAEGYNFSGMLMVEVMTYPVIILKESELNNVGELIKIFTQHHLRHLPIVNDSQQVVGLITYESLLCELSNLERIATQKHLDDAECIVCRIGDGEKKYHSLAENMADGIYLISTKGTGELLYLNPAIAKIFGRPREYFFTNYPDSVFNCIHPDDLALFRSTFFPEQGERQNHELTYRMIKPNGEIRYIRDRAHIIFDATGQVEAYQGIITDITEAQQAEQALRDSERRYATLAENLPVGIFCTDIEGNCEYVNRKWEEIVGLTLTEVLGKTWLQALHPEDRDRVIYEWNHSVAHQKPLVSEHRFQTSSGKTTWVFARATQTIDHTGNGIGYVGTLTDISESRRMEKQLATQNDILARVARGEPLTDVLQNLITSLAEQFDDALFCILLLDEENRLCHGASLNLPADYIRITEGIKIGESVGSCGTAMYRQQVVISSDIANDPLWQDFKHLALPYELRACWSAPIIGSDQQTLGTFAFYYHQVKTPQASDIEAITMSAYIAGIAIERHRAVIALEKSASFLRAIYEDVEQAIFIVDIDPQGEYRYGGWNPCAAVFCGVSGEEGQGKTPQELLGQEKGQLLCQHYDTCVTSKQPFSFEECFSNPHANRSYWLIVTLKPLLDATGQVYRLIGTAADITAHRRAEESLRTLVEGTATVTGSEFFSALASYAAKALNVPYVVVTELIGDRLYTLGFCAYGELQPLTSYAIVATPCEQSLAQGIYYCPRNARQLFPQDLDLVKMQAESYLGIALQDNNAEIIGNLCVVDTKPLEEPERIKATIRVFAARAAAELARQRATRALEGLNEQLETKVARRTAALQASEARFRATFEQANVGMVELDISGRLTRMNQKFCELIGFSEAELLGRGLLELTHPDEISICRQQLQRLVDDEIQTFQLEKRYVHKQGHCVWTHLTVSLVRSLHYQPQYFIGVIQDISEAYRQAMQRKKAEEILQKQAQRERLLRSITQHIRQSLDLKSILCAAVNEVRQTFQADRTLIFHLMSNNVGVVLEESVAPEYPLIGSLLSENECFPEACYEFYREGKVRIVCDPQNDDWTDCLAEFMAQTQVKSKIVAPIVQKVENQPPRVWGLISVHACGTQRQWQPDEANLLQQIASQLSVAIQQADLYEQVQAELSDRKRAETALSLLNEQLLAINTELARATRLKDEFLASMSHELRTPLNAILGMSEGLLDGVFGQITQRQEHALSTIERSGKHLLELINDILDLAKIEAGKLELQIAPVSVIDLCESSLAFVKQLAYQKRIQLHMDIDSTISEITVDERRIRQVLINLLNNAVKFTPEAGSITLTVRRETIAATTNHPPNSTTHIYQSPNSYEQLANAPITVSLPQFPIPTHWVSFAVIDTGIGIAPEDMEKLFQSFVQIDSRLNRQYTGTGLGLALVRQIIELHGGQVSVNSKVGQGSTFTVRLPDLDQKLILPTPIADVKLESTVLSTMSSIVVKSPLILLAEDNQANIETISSYLESRGYNLIVATDGQTAVDLAISQSPSLILMDIQLPVINGLEAIRQIRECSELSNVSIIALTALAMPGDREKCLQAGANDYINKPVKLRELTTRIQKLLR